MSTADNHAGCDGDAMRPRVYGLAAGDALGAPYGFRGRGTFERTGMADGGTHGRFAGTPVKVDFRLRYGRIASRPAGAVKSDGYREHTLEAAPRCFPNTGPYADCVPTAVNLGGDTDTAAAVAGAPAGVRYGFEAIPPKRIGRLRGKAVIDRCVQGGDRR